jgi:hypothetical protein
MAVDFGNGPQIKSRAIQGAKVDVQIGDTSAYASLANNPLEGLTIPSEKDEVLNQIDNGEKKGTKLDQRIKKAEDAGNTSKAARLTGKKERRTQRDTEKAKRVTQRNKERLAETTRRSEKKTENFTNRRVGEDGELGTEDDKRPFDLMQPFAKKTPFPMKTFDKFSTIAKKL